jgi:hypothetical protein
MGGERFHQILTGNFMPETVSRSRPTGHIKRQNHLFRTSDITAKTKPRIAPTQIVPPARIVHIVIKELA